MSTEVFDLLVIGGGITGAGTARAAALRGLKVALVEKEDFASGTSSRSSKIVHGGVRYLEYLQIGMVRESARERAVLQRIAPHLVHPLPFLYPVWKGESFLRIRAGLLLFDLLAGRDRGRWSRSLDAEETRARLPGLREPLRGAVAYPEYITDDARFTLANVASAAAHGARVANHARVERLLLSGESVVGAEVRDLTTGSCTDVRARVTVNAAGPWVSRVLRVSGVPLAHEIVPSKGIHIALPRERLPIEAATFIRSRAGRSGLAMPRGPWVYVGTSDDEYHGDLDDPRAEPAEIDELLALVRECFPDAGLGPDDVTATWAGIRPLVRERGKSTREMSRHDEVWTSPGLVTVAGGKLTTYRPMAGRILRAVEEARVGPAPDGVAARSGDPTARVLLPGAPPGDLEAFRRKVDAELAARGVPAPTRARLHSLYGTELHALLALGRDDPAWLEPLAPGFPALRGEVRRAVDEEMALTLNDLLDRRLALLLFSPDRGLPAAQAAAEIAAERLGWDEARIDHEVERYRQTAREHGPRGRATPR